MLETRESLVDDRWGVTKQKGRTRRTLISILKKTGLPFIFSIPPFVSIFFVSCSPIISQNKCKKTKATLFHSSI